MKKTKLLFSIVSVHSVSPEHDVLMLNSIDFVLQMIKFPHLSFHKEVLLVDSFFYSFWSVSVGQNEK